MARIAGINIPVNKHAVIALQAIYGIGPTRAKSICTAVQVPPDRKIRDLDDAQVDAPAGSLSSDRHPERNNAHDQHDQCPNMDGQAVDRISSQRQQKERTDFKEACAGRDQRKEGQQNAARQK